MGETHTPFVDEANGTINMHIKSISISKQPPLQQVSFDCHERVNLFIGPNASGKSTILRFIDSAYHKELQEIIASHDGDGDLLFFNNNSDYQVIDLSDDWPRDCDEKITTPWDALPLLYIPATRVNLPGMNVLNYTINKGRNGETDTPLEALFETHSGVFNGQYLEHVIAWFLDPRNFSIGVPLGISLPPEQWQTHLDEQREQVEQRRRQAIQLRKALTAGYSCTKRICHEVIRGDTTQTYIELDLDHEISSTGRVTHPGMGILDSDDIFAEPLYAGVLSSGTQSTLLWVWALALKIALHYLEEDGWEKKPAILLIDEIENHLHPTWQRRVIPALLEHFPGLQIFATTHSPFMVAGLKAGQVHLLNRDADGVVTATTNERDVIGWTADEILRTMMGVDEPTDQLTVDRANRLRQLREKETLSPAEEAELNALRRQVNEALLSRSGPIEAQRERYADLMKRFLLSRQSDLTQDGE